MNSMDFTKTTDEFEQWFKDHNLIYENTQKWNKNWYEFLKRHQAHNWTYWSSDYAYIDDNGDLRMHYDNELMDEGIGNFYFVDME